MPTGIYKRTPKAVPAPIMSTLPEASVELRLPFSVAQFISRNEEAAAEFLVQWAEHHKNPDAYQASQETNLENPVPLLIEAERTINGPRQHDYGDKLINFSQISMFWQALFAMKLQPDARITPEDVSLAMICVKMSRLAKSPDHRDSILDTAGYAGCYDKLQEERKAGGKLPGAIRDARA